ncbi:MAG: hypothetical protein VKO64_04735 [Candidatus Sericytochromatia bacterium]|nr:hypothetical protein [Candidatus Sericytochromatia bacterium]
MLRWRPVLSLMLLGCGATGWTAPTAIPAADPPVMVVLGPQGAHVTMVRRLAFPEGQTHAVLGGLPPGLEGGSLSLEGVPDLAEMRVRPHAGDTASLVADAHGSEVLVETHPGASPRPVRIGGHPERPLYKMGEVWYAELPGKLALPSLPAAAEGTRIDIGRKGGAPPWQGLATLRFLDGRSHWRSDTRIVLDATARRADLENWALVQWAAGGYGNSVGLDLVVQPLRQGPGWELRSLAADAMAPALQAESGLWRWRAPGPVDSGRSGLVRLLLSTRSGVPARLEQVFRLSVPWNPWQDDTPHRAETELKLGTDGGTGLNCPPGRWQVSRRDATGRPMPVAQGQSSGAPVDARLSLGLGQSLDTLARLVQKRCTDDEKGYRQVALEVRLTHAGNEPATVHLSLRPDAPWRWLAGTPSPDLTGTTELAWTLTMPPGSTRSIEVEMTRVASVSRVAEPGPGPQ